MGTLRRQKRRQRARRFIKANCPVPKPHSKKRHKGEPLDDFEQRRRVCNNRRRERERVRFTAGYFIDKRRGLVKMKRAA